MPAYLVVAWDLAVVILIACIAAGVVEVVGADRLGRWLGLDVRGDDR
jgi:hypothetical protein